MPASFPRVTHADASAALPSSHGPARARLPEVRRPGRSAVVSRRAAARSPWSWSPGTTTAWPARSLLGLLADPARWRSGAGPRWSPSSSCMTGIELLVEVRSRGFDNDSIGLRGRVLHGALLPRPARRPASRPGSALVGLGVVIFLFNMSEGGIGQTRPRRRRLRCSGFVGAPWAAGLDPAAAHASARPSSTRRTSGCAASRRSASAARSPRSGRGSPASCTTSSRTRSR